MVDFAGEHSDEDDHEDERGDCKNKHKNALHKASHDVIRLVFNFLHLCLSLINIHILQSTNILNDFIITPELLLKALCDIFHVFSHVKHILLNFPLFFCFIPFFLIIIYLSTAPLSIFSIDFLTLLQL